MNLLLKFFPGLAPYQLIAKLVGAALLCIALLYAWHRFTGHYEDIGFHKRDLEVAQKDFTISKLSAGIEQQNHAIEVWKADGDAKHRNALEAIKKATEDSQYLEQNIIAIAKREHSVTGPNRTCEQAVSDAKGDLAHAN